MRHLEILDLIVGVGSTGSVRGTADRMNITASALTRRIQEFERELGAPIFERLPRGMRLNPAGELLVQHIRSQAADFDRLKSQLADLAGLHRGHVSIACSQAFVDHVLPAEIRRFRASYPHVTFKTAIRDHASGVAALKSYDAELAVLLHTAPAPDLEILLQGEQALCVVMRSDHPLAGEGPVRLHQGLRFPTAMPDHSLAIRHMLDSAIARGGLSVDMQIESNSIDFLRSYVLNEDVVSFQIAVGVPATVRNLCFRPVDGRDLPPARLIVARLRGRTLTAAASRFAAEFAKHPLWQPPDHLSAGSS